MPVVHRKYGGYLGGVTAPCDFRMLNPIPMPRDFFDPTPEQRVTGSDPSVTDYILEEPAKCPNCRGEILEKTLIEPV